MRPGRDFLRAFLATLAAEPAAHRATLGLGALATADADADAGSLLVHNGSTWAALPAGTNGQILKIVDGAPQWTDP